MQDMAERHSKKKMEHERRKNEKEKKEQKKQEQSLLRIKEIKAIDDYDEDEVLMQELKRLRGVTRQAKANLASGK